jgi:DNA adenine methylase
MSSVPRPVLRYHGGKWLLAPWIIEHFPPHKVYIECFGGAGSVLLRKPRSGVEIYNDLSGEMVNFMKVLRDHGAELERRLRLTPFARDEFNASYEATDDSIERARRTAVRAQMGFGTSALVRSKTGFRRSGHRNSTKSYASDWAQWQEGIGAVVERLRGVVIENAPAVEIIRALDEPRVLFYCDPPYVHSTRSNVSSSNRYGHEMTDEDHRDLAAVLHEARAAVVLSGYHSPLYDELYGDWHQRERVARAQGQDGAIERLEVLWMNQRAASALSPDLFGAT